MQSDNTVEQRRRSLAAARLYLVCPQSDARASLASLPDLLRASISGGVDIVQLRDKLLADDELAAVANAVHALTVRLGALLIVNDRPSVAIEVGADGVHVGQEDMPAAEVREMVGADMLVGLSTHSPEEIDAVDPAVIDYIGVGPVHETPTKPGRAAVGPELVRYAVEHAPVPFFAIGGLDETNVGEVIAAGASRVCVLRAISAAEDPEAAAAALRAQLDAAPQEH